MSALLPAEAVAAVPRIVLQEDQHIRAVADRFFAATAPPPSPPLVADQMMSSFALTCAGAGLSLITDSVIRYGNYARLPAFYAFAPALSCRTLALASKRGGYLSHAAEEFLRLTRACYASPASSV